MSFVLDASVACAWIFADEATKELDELLAQSAEAEVFVPSLWRSEVLNTLVQASRRNRITTDQIATYWSHLDALQISESTYVPPAERIVSLCQEHNLTAYDATYLALAIWLKLPLATLDEQLRQAARKENVNVLGV